MTEQTDQSNPIETAIRDACEKAQSKGWTTNAIAEAAGVANPVLYRFLNRQRGLSIDAAARLCEHFCIRLTVPKIKRQGG